MNSIVKNWNENAYVIGENWRGIILKEQQKIRNEIIPTFRLAFKISICQNIKFNWWTNAWQNIQHQYWLEKFKLHLHGRSVHGSTHLPPQQLADQCNNIRSALSQSRGKHVYNICIWHKYSGKIVWEQSRVRDGGQMRV